MISKSEKSSFKLGHSAIVAPHIIDDISNSVFNTLYTSTTPTIFQKTRSRMHNNIIIINIDEIR